MEQQNGVALTICLPAIIGAMLSVQLDEDRLFFSEFKTLGPGRSINCDSATVSWIHGCHELITIILVTLLANEEGGGHWRGDEGSSEHPSTLSVLGIQWRYVADGAERMRQEVCGWELRKVVSEPPAGGDVNSHASPKAVSAASSTFVHCLTLTYVLGRPWMGITRVGARS